MALAVNAMQPVMAILRAITEIHLIYLAIVIIESYLKNVCLLAIQNYKKY